MARNRTSTSTNRKPAEQSPEPTSTEQGTTEQGSEPKPEPDALTTFNASWDTAVGSVTNVGTVPSEQVANVIAAWRGLSKSQQGDAPSAAQARTMAAAMADPTKPDLLMMAAAGALRAAVDAAVAQGDVSPEQATARIFAARVLLMLAERDAERRGYPTDVELGSQESATEEDLADLWSRAGFGGRAPSLTGAKRSGGSGSANGGGSGERAPSGSVANYVSATLAALSDGTAVTYDGSEPKPDTDADGYLTVASLRHYRAPSEPWYNAERGAPSAGAITNAVRGGIDGVDYAAKPERVRLTPSA